MKHTPVVTESRGREPQIDATQVSVRDAPWLPYWDADLPPRKLAPQFRSAGVGYIRLGDDMSQNGLAFVSADGASFLSDVGWESSHAPPPPSALSSCRSRIRGKTPRFGNMMGDRSGARSPARSSSEKRSAGGASPKNTGVRKLGELRAAAK